MGDGILAGETASLVLPGLSLPDGPRIRESEQGGARVWTDTSSSAAVSLLPDLSRDVVLATHSPVVTSRTNALTRIQLDEHRPVAGVRLPIAATHVRVDRTWTGWRSRCAPEERLADALAAGAISWASDPLVSAGLEGMHDASPIARIASGLFVSERTLRRRFRAALGVGPVYARRVLRLHRLAHHLQRTGTAAAVSAAGFADHSHAARDVHSLTGLRLGEFSRSRVSE